MTLPVLALLFQTSGVLPGGQPVRVWLEPTGVVVPGERMSVFVTTARDGHVLALRVTADRRVEIVFPADPADGTFIAAGTYELRGRGDGAAFVAAEPPGSGVVVVALAAVPFDFGEFVTRGAWDQTALAAVLTSGDAVGALLDIAQRMLGPEYFNYDVIRYTVAPRVTAPPAVVVTSLVPYPVCYGWDREWGCALLLRRPVLPCGAGPGHVFHGSRCQPRCRLVADCAPAPRPRAVALYRGSRPIAPPPRTAPPAAQPPRERPRRVEPRDRRPALAPVASAPRSPVPITAGRRVAPVPPRNARVRIKPRPPAARALPESVPWPRSGSSGAIAREAPAAASDQPSGAQTTTPAWPVRVDRTAATVPVRGALPARAVAVPFARPTGTTPAATSARAAATARPATRGSRAVAPARSGAAPARAASGKGTRSKP